MANDSTSSERRAQMILQESLRVYPPVWVIPRDAISDDEIGGHRIPAGSTILLSPYLTHRHPAFWENPEAFDPDRFLPARSHDRPKLAYFPFGGARDSFFGDLKVHGRDAFEFYTDKKVTISRWF